MRSLNILQFTLGFYPAASWGGPVKTVYVISQELIRRGHRVTVYCSNLQNKRENIKPNTFSDEIDGIRVVYFNTWRFKSWPGTLGPAWMPNLSKALADEIRSFDVIHVNGYRNLTNLPVIASANRNNIPYILQPHGGLPVIVNSFFLKRMYDMFLGKLELKKLSALVATQKSEYEQAIARGVAPEKIYVIPNGLPSTALRNFDIASSSTSFRSKYELPEDLPIILFLARINKKKGADLLVDAFAKMTDREPILVIAGPDDGQLSEIKTLVERYGLQSRVFFPGLLVGDDVTLAYQSSKLFVLPCRVDTFPMAVIEACQAELPMVVTETCEVADLIKGRIADIVPFDAQALADAMTRLLVDQQRYRIYQENCAQMMADTFSIQSMVDKLEALYLQVLENEPNSQQFGNKAK